MARRIEPSRKSPADRLEDLLHGYADAAMAGSAAALKYLDRTLEASGSLPNAVKFFAHALRVEAASGLGTPEGDDQALEALSEAERYLGVARDELPRLFEANRESLRFLEKGISIRSDHGEFEEALRLCDLALALGYGPAFSAKRNSLLRMV